MAITAIVTLPASPCSRPAPIPLCIDMYGGGEYCLPTSTPGFKEAIRALKDLGQQINPFIPGTRLFKVVEAIKDCIEELPVFVVSVGTDTGFPNALVKLGVAVGGLASLDPITGFVLMVLGYLKAIRAFLVALRGRLLKYIADYAKLASLQTLANALGNASMIANANNAKCNLDVEVAALFAELHSGGSVIKLVQTLVCIIGGGEVTLLPALDPTKLSDAVALLDVAISALDTLIDFVSSLPGIKVAFAC